MNITGYVIQTETATGRRTETGVWPSRSAAQGIADYRTLTDGRQRWVLPA